MASKTLTKEEWKKLEESTTMYSSNFLLIDGYKITIKLIRSDMKLKYMIYVNGWFKGEYLKDGNPIKEKFYFKRSKLMRPMKDIKRAQRNLGKKIAREIGLTKEQSTIHYHVPYYNSFSTLRRTLEQNNDSIELIQKS